LWTLVRNSETVSLATPVREGQATLEHCLADEAAVDASTIVMDRELQRRVRSLLKRLDPREALVLRARFGLGGGEDQTLAQVGRELGVCRERARQIQANALAALRVPASEAGLTDYLDC
jgi:RNA polymerase primary sigma factor